jgi:hypothetical protein
MKAEEAKKVADTQLERLAQALKEGKSEALQSYLSALSKFHKYSFRNVMLILSQRPEATRVAGFQTWKKIGRWVKKGEKGIAVIVPMPVRRAESTADRDEKLEEIFRFKAGFVFDVCQTEGQALPVLSEVQGEPGEYAAKLKALLAEKQIGLEYTKELGGADGASQGGKILIKAGLGASTEFSIIVHELAHELLHYSADRKEKNKRVRETEAEAVAFVVSEAIGLRSGTACTDYIQLYQGDADTLKDSLDAIQRTATVILSALHPEA